MSEENQSLREVIYTSLQQRETEELLAIWKQKDRERWTDIAFEAIHDILVERLGSVPEQDGGEVLGAAEPVGRPYQRERRNPSDPSPRLPDALRLQLNGKLLGLSSHTVYT